jgi:hypothetical protein
VSHITVNQSTRYRFILVCSQVIRNRTEVKIRVPNDYALNNPEGNYTCSTDNPLLMTDTRCQLVSVNGTLYLLFAYLTIAFNDISVVVNVELTNPHLPFVQAFSATLTVAGFGYATTNNASISIANNTVVQLPACVLTALPTAAGAYSIYILQVEGSTVDT